ncbi:hypothetical protein GCWU000321_01150 [Dialister invisus DSM 15470]|uniref:Uncharacterized protein n=1 Tax=Dialister invisus DSM 15470 TaxID=592028 RepID=C9LNM7_9FIRM|nr:hypothetical protein GCWU000321_01150 [Dialister invisus DSM 15470]
MYKFIIPSLSAIHISPYACCSAAGRGLFLQLFLRFTSCLPHTIMKENIFL